MRSIKPERLLDELLAEIANLDSDDYDLEACRGVAIDLASHLKRIRAEREVYASRALIAESSLHRLRDGLRRLTQEV